MPIITLQTEIEASREIVFDLSRSIDLHKISTSHTNETAISGKTSGLINLNESVTWRAQHLGVYQNLTSMITEYDFPNYFVDEMISGAFKKFKHEHHFRDIEGKTLMTDVFDYKSPLGILGHFVDWLFLKNYMTSFLKDRNKTIKRFAETGKYREIL